MTLVNDRQLERYRECKKLLEYSQKEVIKPERSYSEVQELIKKINRCKQYISWFECDVLLGKLSKDNKS